MSVCVSCNKDTCFGCPVTQPNPSRETTMTHRVRPSFWITLALMEHIALPEWWYSTDHYTGSTASNWN